MDVTEEVRSAARNMFDTDKVCFDYSLGICSNLRESIETLSKIFGSRDFLDVSGFVRDYVKNFFPEFLSDCDRYIIRAEEHDTSQVSAEAAYLESEDLWDDSFHGRARKVIIDHMVENSDWDAILVREGNSCYLVFKLKQ